MIELLESRFFDLRDEDLARWGAMMIEDIGVVEVDRVVGRPKDFGRAIRTEICSSDHRLNQKWREIAHRVQLASPSTANPNEMLVVLCLLATAVMFTEGRIGAASSD